MAAAQTSKTKNREWIKVVRRQINCWLTYCVLKCTKGQETPPAARWQPARLATASVLPGASRLPADCFCRHRLGGYIVLGTSWVGWHSPEASRWHQRWGCSDRTSERSCDLFGARMVREVQRDETLGLRRPWFCLRRRRWSRLCANGLRGWQCDCFGLVALPFAMAASRLWADDTADKFAWPASVTWNMPRPSGQTRMDKLPKKWRQRGPKKLLLDLSFSNFPSLKMPLRSITFRPIRCKLNNSKK